MITAVTTCKGRREHLEITLPLMLEEFDRVIVVDWDCPDNVGEWAMAEGASVVFKRDEPLFNAARARNFGARDVMTRKVCFIDADVMVGPGLVEEIEGLLALETMVIAPLRADGTDVPNLCGFLAVDIGQFWGVGGYNESLEGYAIEDLYLRAQLLVERGVKAKRVSPSFIGALKHSNEIRGRYFSDPIDVSSKRNYDSLIAYLKSHGISDWLTDPRAESIAYRKPAQ